MNNDSANRTLPCCALVFVVPAPVPKPGFAGKQVRVPVRVIVHYHQDLAFEVLAFEIVPVVLGRLNPVSDKDYLCVGYFCARCLNPA